MPHTLPKAMIEFLTRYIHSVEQLEVLLLLRREAERRWTAREVSAVLRTIEDSAALRLSLLHTQKFLSLETEAQGETRVYQYAASQEQEKRLLELESFYKTHSSRIIELIYSKPNPAILGFSSSFLLWRRDDD